MKRIVLIVIFVILAVALVISGRRLLLDRQEEAAKEQKPLRAPITVTLAHGKRGTMERTLPVLLRLEAKREIKLSTKLAGRIEKIFVEESRSVKKGELLLQIDSRELRNALESARVALEARISDRKLAESIYKRNLKLYAAGGLAKEQLDASRVALENKRSLESAASSQISQIEAQLSYLEIRAPFAGRIDRLLLREGDLAAVGKPILTLQSLEQKLTFTYAPRFVKEIREGQEIRSGGKRVGRVSRLYLSAVEGLPQAEATPEGRVTLPTGSDFEGELLLEKKEGCILPADTIIHRDNGIRVMLYRNGKFQEQKIEPTMLTAEGVLLSECPADPVARGSETNLALLPSYGKVEVVETKR